MGLAASRATSHLILAILLAGVGHWCRAADDALPEGVVQVSPSEFRIDRHVLAGRDIDAPMPQGLVDVNPPWLHVRVPLTDEVGEPVANAKRPKGPKQIMVEQKWNRRYYFKLSRDPDFRQAVIESGPMRWSFFSPYRRLEKGTWYWTYGVASPHRPDQPLWKAPTYSFVVDAKAFSGPIPPSADAVLAEIHKHRTGPIVSCASEDIGQLLPTTRWPSLAERMLIECKKAMKEGNNSITLEIDDTKFPSYMNQPTEVYFTNLMRSQFTRLERMVDTLLRGYLLTGDPRMKELGVKRAVELEELRLSKVHKILGKSIPLRQYVLYNTVPMLIVDAFYDDLTAPQQKLFVDLIDSMIREKGEADGPDMHEQLEHTFFNQHAWQMKMPNLLLGSLVLSRRVPEMEEWFRYAYDLWVYRNPALSRNDGGSIDGNGYLGVHEEPQTHVNWILYRFTGFNFFRSKHWFDNFPTYMSYVNAAGNMAAPYCDGGDGGPGCSYLTEIMAYMRPDNPVALWRFKSQGVRDVQHYAADMAKGSKAWDMLAVWRKFPTPPEIADAKPPKELADAFRDVGIVAMHTNMAGPTDDLMVNFSSALYGSRQHLHPSQNAFCVAYGGEPLFWRTGYYNGGARHDMLSYKCSRAHNTIMANGMMQGFDLSAYGWIPRFVTGKNISYALGDASRAYTGTFPKFDKWKDTLKAEDGFGKPGVTRFRRHLAFLRPSHLVVYDELEAETPIPWTFMLHAITPIQQIGNAQFQVANNHAMAYATLLCANAVVGSVTDQFYAPAVDDENKRGGQNPPNWHVSITTKEPLRATRFLTVIEVVPGKVGSTFDPKQERLSDGRVRLQLGNYAVIAELDPTRPSYLEAQKNSGASALVTGQAASQLQVGNKTHVAQHPGGTLLWDEQVDGPARLQEVIDQLPDVLFFGNRF